MKFSEQTDFLYDPTIFSCQDTQTALKIHREYIHRHRPMKDGVPAPQFL